jgi:hypothetical protein
MFSVKLMSCDAVKAATMLSPVDPISSRSDQQSIGSAVDPISVARKGPDLW